MATQAKLDVDVQPQQISRLTSADAVAGELMTNASTERLTSSSPIGPRLLRGANINYYVMLDQSKQGEALFLKERQFLREHAADIRSTHHLQERIGFQKSCPIDNWRRLIACRIPAGHYCVHTVRYFTAPTKYDIFVLLAFFNSAMADWRFSLTSTNNDLNEYAVDAIPIAKFECLERGRRGDGRRVDARPDECRDIPVWEETVRKLMRTTSPDASAWPDTIHDALAGAGRELTRLAEGRQSTLNSFSDWLFGLLRIDPERFTGITVLRGGQASVDELSPDELMALLVRNRRAAGEDPERHASDITARFAREAASLHQARARFDQLTAAVDRIVWQLVGLAPDGSVTDKRSAHVVAS